ncbi:hypothetical protein FOA52_008412, partial [Chlamydomonas sp. UWO 241]
FVLRECAAAFLVADIRSSNARRSPDRTKILDRIGGPKGIGHRDLNMQLKMLYNLNPILGSKMRLSRLLNGWSFRAGMARHMHRWMDPYVDWLNLPVSHPNYKCFSIVGSPGSGKSTLAAGLVTVVPASGLDLRPHAHHFAVQTECATVAAVGMLKACAWQLATSVPDLQVYLTGLDATKVAKLTSVDAAFQMLLRAPLNRLARDGKAPPNGIIFVVDGLEEADSLTGCDNPLLMVLRELFPALPSFCRLVITCRPEEADGPSIIKALRAKYSPMEVNIRDLVPRDFILTQLEMQLDGLMEAGSPLPDAAHRIMRRGFDNMLYASVVVLGMRVGSGSKDAIVRQWSAEDLSQLPMDLANVYAAAFQGCLRRLPEARPGVRTDVQLLIAVLTAAREPLSVHQLHGMGLSHALPLLPGWGSLFYEAGSKVRIFHKTLHDWLRTLDPALVAGDADPYRSPSRVSFAHKAGGPGAGLSIQIDGHADRDAPPPPATLATGSRDLAGAGGAQSSRQRQEAVALRLANMLGGREQPGRPMTTAMADEFDLQLNIAAGHSAIARLLMGDLETIKGGSAPGAQDSVTLSSTARDRNLRQLHGIPSFSCTAATGVAAAPDGLGESEKLPQDGCRQARTYSLRHAVSHMCLSGDAGALDALLLNFDFWEAVYAAGFGPLVFLDLLELMPPGSAVAQDVMRWLRSVNDALVVQPRAALQLAADAPSKSLVSLAAARFHRAPDALLLAKLEVWSPCVLVLKEPGGSRFTSVAFSPDGSRLASGSSSKNVRIWDTKTATQIALMEGPSSIFTSVAMYPDGSKVAAGSADKTIHIWDAKSNELIQTFDAHRDTITCIAISPDSNRMASCSSDRTIRIFDLQIMEEVDVCEGHRDAVYSLAFSSDSLRLVSGSADRSVRIWDTRTGKQLTHCEGHFGVVSTVACSPVGTQFASSGGDKTIRLWDGDTGAVVSVLTGHTGSVASITYSNKGMRIASVASDKSVRVWDVRLMLCVLVIERQVGSFTGVRFAFGGRQLLTVSSDKTMRTWDSKHGEELSVMEGHADGIVHLDVTSDGMSAATASLDRSVRLWDLKAEQQLSVLK